MKAFVTGIAGFVGSHVASRLLQMGADVVGIDAFTDYYSRDLKERNLAAVRSHGALRFVEGAVQSTDLTPLLDGVTHVFHFAAQAGVRKSWGQDFLTYLTQNVDATQRLLEAVKDRPIERLVYASSSSVYGDDAAMPMREDAAVQPLSPYGVTKLAAEHLCVLYHRNYGVPTVSLRFFTVYGPRQRPDMGFHRFITAALRQEPITLYGDGEQTRDFTFIDDIVAGVISAAERGAPGAVYNLGGGSRVSVNAVLDQLAGLVGGRLDVRREGAQRGDMRDTYADTTRARADLGFVPAWTLARGLKAEFDWLAASR